MNTVTNLLRLREVSVMPVSNVSYGNMDMRGRAEDAMNFNSHKVFSTGSHSIPALKLHYGLDGWALRWVKS